MPSIFPKLLNYSHLVPFILRLSLAAVLLRFGYLKFKAFSKYEKTTGVVQILSAIFLLLGLFTQIASLLIILLALGEIIESKIKRVAITRKAIKLLILAMALSLVLLGPGLFAIDLPL